jgi:hypothetical protein
MTAANPGPKVENRAGFLYKEPLIPVTNVAQFV